MDKPLSYSGYKRYSTCPKYYQFYDIDKDRPGKETSALIVGTIIDEAAMLLLEGKRDEAYAGIDKAYALACTKDIEFYPDDFDADLVDLKECSDFATKMGWTGDDIKAAVMTFLKEQSKLSKKQRAVMDVIVWKSIETKIYAMIASFEKWILPLIAQVHDVQTHLDNGTTHGYLDFTATMKDGRKVLFDLKTSKMPYAQDAVLNSPQLSLYAAMHGYDYAGYIVLCKTLRKNKVKHCQPCDYTENGGRRLNCPTCKTRMDSTVDPTSYSQIIIDKVPQHNKDLTTQAMSETIKAIDAGHFQRNLNACFYMYGKPCPYLNKCWRKK